MKEPTISKDTIYQGKIFTVEKHNVEIEHGSTSVREIVSHSGASAVLPIVGSNVYLIKQYRKALERETLEIPAGVAEPNEDPKNCAARELTEELKMASDNLEYLTTFQPSPGYLYEPVHLYLATDLHFQSAPHDEDEILEVVAIQFNELLQKIWKGEIKDAKTLISILFYSQYY